ncbi:hypothetical protein NQZ79_g4545 [Umbelopsis isabellina]|nr:hypothetical protein NQZ79_g4545 [Umbelopsis isabellina]
MNKIQTNQNRVPRHAPEISNTTERLKIDLDKSKKLAKALEFDLGENLNGLEAVQNVNRSMSYQKKCVEPHYRKSALLSGESSNDPKEAKRVARWAENLDQKIDMRTNTPDDSMLEKMGGKVLQKEIDAFVEQNVLKEHDAKFKCKVKDCKKAFKGYNYVEKHINSKHAEEIESIKNEVEFFNNYVLDPNHLVPTSGQQSMQGGAMPPNIPMPTTASAPFMMGVGNTMRMGSGFGPMQAAVMGTPWNQIPRIGFNDNAWAPMQSRDSRNSIPDVHGPGGVPAGAGMDMPKDPRQVTSYVDLDAPAEGDTDMSYL